MDAAEIARTFDGRASSFDDSATHRWQAGQVALFAGPALGDYWTRVPEPAMR